MSLGAGKTRGINMQRFLIFSLYYNILIYDIV